MAKKVAMIGAGAIGRAYAICFSRGGYEVSMFDPVDGAAEASIPRMRETAEDLEAEDFLNGHSADAVMGRISIAPTTEAAVDGAVHVQENAPEKLELKKKIFAELDALCPPDVVLASSTSTIVASMWSDGLPGKHRCMVAHPTNPPYAVRLIEIVPAPWTDTALVAATRTLFEEIGLVPITLKKEILGFIMNRFQAPILHEAYRLVAAGVATPGDVDLAMSEGISQRWSFIGPFEQRDINHDKGIRESSIRGEPLNRAIAETQRDLVPWDGPLVDYIEQERRKVLPMDQLQDRMRWRDKRLVALAKHKKWADENIK